MKIFLNNNKNIFYLGTCLFLGIILIYFSFFNQPNVKLLSFNNSKTEALILVENIKKGDVLMLLNSADKNCDLGKVESISVANAKKELIKINITNLDFINFFRIKVVSGKNIFCSSEIIVNLNPSI